MTESSGRRQLVSIQDAAEYLGVAPLTVRRMTSRGDLAAVRIGSSTKAPIRVDMTQIEGELLRPIPAAAGE